MIQTNKQPTQRCSLTSHGTATGSPYNRNYVPLHLFHKDPNDPNSVLLKTCQHCVRYHRAIAANRKELVIASQTDKHFRYCPDDHSTSIYPRDKVPIELFRKEPNNPKSILLQSCSDCRKIRAVNHREIRKRKMDEAAKRGMFYCTNCHHEKLPTERANNLNGTPSTLCIRCKVGEGQRGINIRQIYRNIKLEFVTKHQNTCYKCQKLHIIVDNSIVPLTPFNHNGTHMVNYNGEQYITSDFIDKKSELLALDIIQLDHLTESEQRERGLLQPHEPYIAKKRQVSKLSSESAMRLEAHKCQHLCALCHLTETIRRETGIAYNSRSHSERDKLEYATNLKRAGCSICHYINADLPRFFHFDHLDPSIKLKEIARMIKDNSYTMSELVEECAKCRIVCGHCHIMHTLDQRKRGTVSNRPRLTTVLKKLQSGQIISKFAKFPSPKLRPTKFPSPKLRSIQVSSSKFPSPKFEPQHSK